MKSDPRFEAAGFWDREKYLGDSNQVHRYKMTVAMIPPDGESLLDVGAGNGAFLRVLEEQFLTLKLRGIDLSPNATSNRLCAAEVALASITAIPFDDKSFDVVTALEILEHLNCTQLPIAIRELERVAAKYIVISVPYKNACFGMFQCPYCLTIFEIYGHLQRFDEARMSSLFQSFRLEELRIVESRQRLSILGPLRALLPFRPAAPVMPYSTQCPICEYRRERSDLQNHTPKPSLKSRIKMLLPERTVPNWIVGVYRRNT